MTKYRFVTPLVTALLLTVAVLAAALLTAACTTSGDKALIRIDTEPKVAQCEFRGRNFSTVRETPARIAIPRRAAPVIITCRAEGYQDTAGSINPRVTTEVFANLLTGSMMGLVVDLASGAAERWPNQVKIIMEPAMFSTLADRDAWYTRYRRGVIGKWNATLGEMETSCAESGEAQMVCDDQVLNARIKAEQELALLDQRRLGAKVSLGQATAEPDNRQQIEGLIEVAPAAGGAQLP